MITPLAGIALLFFVIVVVLSERSAGKLGFWDWHAFVVVFGGVAGTLLVAIDRRSIGRMFLSLRDLMPRTRVFHRQMRLTEEGLKNMRAAWRSGNRSVILDMADTAPTLELRVAADALLRQLGGAALCEQFTEVRTHYSGETLPLIEGWEMVARLAPSFGMVGTVSGMVQLFRNMAEHSGNLGGAMAMALLATLYGIAFGAAVGGPMASRLNAQLNQRLNMLELIEQSVASLVEESRLTAESKG